MGRKMDSGFERVVADALRLYGWRYVHFRPARTAHGWRTPIAGDRGFPDFVAVKGGRLLFIEVKGQKGHPAPEQRAWGDDLRAAGAEYYVWRPQDLGEMLATLQTRQETRSVGGNGNGKRGVPAVP